MSPAEAVVLALYYITLGILTMYSVHRLYLVRLRRRFPGLAGLLPTCGTDTLVCAPRDEMITDRSVCATSPAAGRSIELDQQPVTCRLTHPNASAFPPLTVQLPLFNEPNVAPRLIEAVARLEYPGALDIQVLDDSTDETPDIVARTIRELPGLRIAHIRRATREGYKAGALAHGMRLSSAELFAVFDADFVPAPDVLLRVVPHFGDPRIGMVQARWGHLNRESSMLTRVQAILLDAHFAVESAARNFGGRFFNFNGTAGVWRRAAIEDAGGWSSSTLTEDLDLSYRAQLAGWKFAFLSDVEVPAELPAELSGFQDQQHRWAKGSIQTARKLLGAIARSDADRATKAEAFFHLTNNSAYLLSLLLALLIVPSIVIRQTAQITWTFAVDFILFGASTGSVLFFYVEGQRWAGRPRPRARDLLAVLPVGVGMAVRNATAVLEGFVECGGHFHRTPKRGDGIRDLRERPPRIPFAELILVTFFALAVVAFAMARQWLSLPFLTLFVSGYGYVSFLALRERLSYGRGS